MRIFRWALGLLAAVTVFMAVGLPASSVAQVATYSLFTPSQGPTSAGGTDQSSVNLGVTFSTSVSGTVSAIKFYRPTGTNSTHTVTLYSSTGTVLGQATSTTETSVGWQQVTLPTPVSIAANTQYVASYFTNGYVANLNYFTTPLTINPFTVPACGGVHQYASWPTLPTTCYQGSNYWIDVVFTPGGALPTATATPTATSTPLPTNTPTPGPSPTPTATPTPKPGPTGFVCTEVIGFSETEQWYDGGFITSVVDPQNWQLRWYSGGSIDLWATGSSFVGWSPANLVSHCASNSATPDRIVLNVSANYFSDPTWWANQTQATINYVKTTYDPTVKQINLQPVVGGPSASMCPTSDPAALYPWVRASWNWPYIESGLQRLVGPGVSLGAYAEVTSCSDYADWVGHLNTTGARTAIGSAIANFYSQR